ncbi:MAG: phospholipase [Alphaproteobacteria bacterium]|nr:phospholipase [Alphaproteobacteria bacterium]
MLENRSFDSMLGMLYEKSGAFDGLSGTERNTWHRPGAPPMEIPVWTDRTRDAAGIHGPDPDPGESFADIHMQIHGLAADGSPNAGGPNMGGFVDNYARQPGMGATSDPSAVMHYCTPDQLPVLSGLARAFGVSDRWHASAPCQTWPNRFFVHTGTANGYVNNFPTHFPYMMDTVFNRLSDVGATWRLYFHDVPLAATLSKLWADAPANFRAFDLEFERDAAAGTLPAYTFIEPRYFTDLLFGRMPNDQHPPHGVAHGEALIAAVYNAVRKGPAWKHTLLIITYDEHGGCYDHVVPPPATPPGGQTPDGFAFDYFGVRVPAVVASPYVKPGSVIRPPGLTPFDHTSILATLRDLFNIAPLTARDLAAPSLLPQLANSPDNDGPARIDAVAVAPSAEDIARAATRPPSTLQAGLSAAALHLPTFGANLALHMLRLRAVLDIAPVHASARDAQVAASVHIGAFLGRI